MSENEQAEEDDAASEEVDEEVTAQEPTEDAEGEAAAADREADAAAPEDDAAEDEEAARDADAGDDDGDDDQPEEGIQDGDFLRVDYTVTTLEDDRVVDTTREDVAEEEGLDEEHDHEFEPRTIVVGAGHVFPAVDEAFVGAEEGDEGTVEVPAEEAFGEYDQEEVRTVSAEKIPEDDRYPGAQVQVDGEQGFVETIIGGRARVDFNHPLAGEDIEYEYEILEVVEDDIEKAAGLLDVYLQQTPEMRIETVMEEEELPEGPEDEEGKPTMVTEEVEKRVLYIEATQGMQMNQQWMFQKQQITKDLMDRLDLDKVIIEEVFDKARGMQGPMGGMMGGAGPATGPEVAEALEDVDVDADELAEELDESEE